MKNIARGNFSALVSVDVAIFIVDVCDRLFTGYLCAGSRRVFGTVLEKSVCFLLDISGSMAPNLSELKRELASLIWEQLHKQRVR